MSPSRLLRSSLLVPLCLSAWVSRPSVAAAQEAVVEKAEPEEAPLDLTDPEAEPEEVPDESADDGWKTAPTLRRGGFMIGLALGGGIGSSAGFPNESKKIGRLEHYTETGIGFGGSAKLFLGGGLIDWLTFGAGLDMNQVVADSTASPSTAIFLHVDAFPLWWMGGTYRDLGIYFDGGTGTATTTPEDDAEELLIDGGAVSYISSGVFWEPIQFWKLSMGPFVGGTYAWSETMRRPMGMLGWRSTIYTKP